MIKTCNLGAIKLYTMKIILFQTLIVLAIIVPSCKKNDLDTQIPQSQNVTEAPLNHEDRLRTEFGKILAKAVNDGDVRRLLKEESMKQFDNDYDVLFQMVKDKALKPTGITFMQYLNSLAGSNDLMRYVDKDLPLVTILVPSLRNFSAEKWDVSIEIPSVAVVNSNHSEKKKMSLVAFDYKGNTLSMASNEEPNNPVIVVKENERVVVAKNADARLNIESNLIHENSENFFYLLDESFDRRKTKENGSSRMLLFGTQTDQRVKDAFTLNAASQRDYVYYNILTSTGQGPLNSNYAEYLYGMKFANTSAPGYVNDDPTTDWSDGALEFQIDVLFFNGSSALSRVSKVVNVPIRDLTHQGELFQYSFPSPIMIATWDLQAMGDTWKYVVNELDPGTVTTQTHTSSSSFGGNFTFEATILKIIKTGFGINFTSSSSTSTQVQLTTGSDFCGEAVVNFLNPVIVQTHLLFGFLPADEIETPNTGTVELLVAPKSIY